MATVVLLAGVRAEARAGRPLQAMQSASGPEVSIELGGFLALFDMVAMDDGRLVGVSSDGIAEYSSGVWWLRESLPKEVQLTSVTADEHVIWAAGRSCHLYRLENQTHSQIPLGLDPCSIRDVAVAANTDLVYMVGQSARGDGVVWQYDGREVSEILRLAGNPLSTLAVLEEERLLLAGPGIALVASTDGDVVAEQTFDACRINDALVTGDGVMLWGGGCVFRREDGSEYGRPGIWRWQGGVWHAMPIRDGGLQVLRLLSSSDDRWWAVGDGRLIYRRIEDEWSVVFDGEGSLFGSSFTAIAETGDSIVVAGSQGVSVTYSDGEFSWYMGRRAGIIGSREFGNGVLGRVALRGDGYALAAGRGGPPVERPARGEAWAEVSSVPHADEVLSVAVAETGEAWFGTGVVKEEGEAVLVRRARDGTVRSFTGVSSLAVWDLRSSGSGRVWGVASTFGLGAVAPVSEIVHFDGASWHQVCQVPGELLITIDVLDESTAVAAGTALVTCAMETGSTTLDVAPSFLTNISRAGPEHVLVTAPGQVLLVDLEDGTTDVVLRGGSAMLGVSGDAQCFMASGEGALWLVHGDSVRRIPVRTSSAGLGSPGEFSSPRYRHAMGWDGDRLYAVATGQWNTVLDIVGTCEARDGTPPPIDATPTPGNASDGPRSRIALPLALSDADR